MSISSALSSVLKKATQSAFPSIRENPAIEYSVNGFRFVIDQWLIEFVYNDFKISGLLRGRKTPN